MCKGKKNKSAFFLSLLSDGKMQTKPFYVSYIANGGTIGKKTCRLRTFSCVKIDVFVLFSRFHNLPSIQSTFDLVIAPAKKKLTKLSMSLLQ